MAAQKNKSRARGRAETRTKLKETIFKYLNSKIIKILHFCKNHLKFFLKDILMMGNYVKNIFLIK